MKFFRKIVVICCLLVMSISFGLLQFNVFAKSNEQKKLQIMNVSDDIKIKSRVLPETFGGKAYGLSLLHEYGYKIPDTVLIEATDDLCTIESDDFKNSLRESIKHLSVNGRYPVAVRSSCTNEDSFEDSKAGQFDTIMGNMSFEELIDNIKKVINGLSKVKDSKGKMGVIIQQKINADYSGVIFSSNPLSYSKKEMIISFIEGIGDKLVSGKVNGTDVLVSVKDEKYKLVSDKDILPRDSLLLLAQKSKELEKKLNYPLDIEWSMVDSELIFLQCRPLSSITKVKSGLHFVNSKNLSSIPKQLISHDKFNLRLSAQKTDTLSSDAYVFIQNNCFEHTDSPPIELKKSLYCIGHNAVITYPEHTNGKVIRSFIGDKSNLTRYIPVCDKYTVNSYPKFKNINECLNEYYCLTKDDYWITSTIIQEILDPIYTGIIQKTSEGYILEITYGNFISKGVVPTSQYVVDNNRKIVSRNEILQNSWYQIVEGHVLFCSYLDNSVLVSLSYKNINGIIDLFEKLSNGSDITLEFGMLKEPKSENMIPFLMDYVKNDSNVSISKTDIEEGIVSQGLVSGKIVHVSNTDTNSIDTHFHDLTDENQKSNENIVFFCHKPDIALLKLLRKYLPDKIGFVFEDCSLLCHFAVLLREKGIPAIKIGRDFMNDFKDGKSCVIDAVTPALAGSERISFLNN